MGQAIAIHMIAIMTQSVLSTVNNKKTTKLVKCKVCNQEQAVGAAAFQTILSAPADIRFNSSLSRASRSMS